MQILQLLTSLRIQSLTTCLEHEVLNGDLTQFEIDLTELRDRHTDLRARNHVSLQRFNQIREQSEQLQEELQTLLIQYFLDIAPVPADTENNVGNNSESDTDPDPADDHALDQ